MNDRIRFEDVLRTFDLPPESSSQLALADSAELLALATYLVSRIMKR